MRTDGKERSKALLPVNMRRCAENAEESMGNLLDLVDEVKKATRDEINI